jgi:hypothetical protein
MVLSTHTFDSKLNAFINHIDSCIWTFLYQLFSCPKPIHFYYFWFPGWCRWGSGCRLSFRLFTKVFGLNITNYPILRVFDASPGTRCCSYSYLCTLRYLHFSCWCARILINVCGLIEICCIWFSIC